MIVILDLGLEDSIESERVPVVIALHIAESFLISHLNSKQFFEGHRICIISPISQIRKEGSETLKGLSKAIQLVSVYFQIQIPLLSPPTMVLPLITDFCE